MKLDAQKTLFISLCAAALASVALGQQPIEPPRRPGFPATLSGSGAVAQPAVGDLDNDGIKEIVAGTRGRRLYVINANGTTRAGWPQTLPAEANGIAIGLLDGDAFPDIAVSYKSTTDPSGIGGVRAYRRDGSILWTRTMIDAEGDGLPDGVFSTPAIGNIDGLAGNEVAFGSFDMNVYVVRGGDGSNLSGWPRFVRDTIWSSPALFDLDADGRLEIVIGVDTHAEGPPFNTPDGGGLYVFRSDATVMPGFPRFFDETTMSSPAIGDIAGDSRPEIVVGGGVYWSTCCNPAVGRKVYAINCDGSNVAGWPVATDGQVFDSPALADLDGNGKLDVVITDGSPNLYAFRGNGTQIFKIRPRSFFGTSPNAANPIVADVTGDSFPEVLVAVNTELAVISRTGAQLTDDGTHDGRLSYFTPTAVTGGVVTDLDNNGVVDVVGGSAEPFPAATSGQIYVWTPAAATSAMPWPMFHQDPSRRGVAPGTNGCARPLPITPQRFFTLPPCRVVDTRLAGLGAPALGANTTRFFPVAGQCGVPATALTVAVNTTVTESGAGGHLTLFPTGSPVPSSSSLNFRAGQTRANNAIISLGLAGEVAVSCAMGSGSVHFILDVFGYFE